MREKLKSNETKKIIKLTGNVLTVIAIVLVIYRLTQYNIDYSKLLSGKNILLVVALMLGYATCLIMLPYAWKNIIDLFGYNHVHFRDVQTVFCKANLMKYIPGNVMQYIGRNEIALQYDLDHGIIAVTTILDIFANVIGIGIVSLLFYRKGVSLFFQKHHINIILVIFFVIILVLLVIILYKYIRTKAIIAARQKICWWKYGFSFLIHALFGILTSGIYIIIMKCIVGTDLANNLLVTVAGAFLLSWLIGFLTPGAPGGIGIREASIVLFLKGFVPEDQILLGIVVFRFINTLGDVAAYGFCTGRKILLNRLAGIQKKSM